MLEKCRVKIVVFAFACAFAVTPHLYAKPDTPKALLFTPIYHIDQNPYFDWVIKERADPAQLEKAKIEYLIERVRKSPYTFVRNGSEYTSNEAAEHLGWKYSHVKDRIQTARQFIEHLATRSSTSGKLYLTKLADGITYPTGEMLTNELDTLESKLADTSSALISS